MEWKPIEIIEKVKTSIENQRDIADKNGHAILLLNQPIINKNVFKSLWNKAALRISVDGGGNQWHNLHQENPSILFPDIVSGDLDSICSEVLNLFKEHKTIEIVETPDQDETDFTKAVRVLQRKLAKDNSQKISKVIAFCETSGRFDQIIANVETLFHALKLLPDTIQLFLMSSSSMTWLLPSGSHKIICGVKDSPSHSIKYCSLIPIGSPSVLTTNGLKWNLTNDTLAFGKLVSTSNEIDANEQIVSIDNSNPILWSMELEYYT